MTEGYVPDNKTGGETWLLTVMVRSSITRQHVSIALLVGLLVLAPGCAAIGDIGTSSDQTENTKTTVTENSSSHAKEGDGHSHGTEGDGHSHGTEDSPDVQQTTGEASGQMSVVINGTVLDVSNAGNGSDTFGFENGSDGTWHRGNATVTVADALSTLGVDATAEQVTYEGTTYKEADENTSINVRVNGERVDPEQYSLKDGDSVWVTVETDEMNASTPGEYISVDDQHIHGDMEFAVNGDEVNFSEQKYQSGHRHFHFEGGHADPWHAHSWSVTLEYAMSTLPGIDVGKNSVTYDNTTYRASDPGTTVTVKVNGKSVDPSQYYLKDGDSVKIIVESNENN